MNYEYADFEFAICSLCILAIVAVVAIFAYSVKNRAMFFAGTIGSLLGCIAPHGGIHINGTAEAVYIGNLNWTASNMLFYGVIGAIVACGLVAAVQYLPKRNPQFSVRALLWTMTVIAVVLGLYQWANQ